VLLQFVVDPVHFCETLTNKSTEDITFNWLFLVFCSVFLINFVQNRRIDNMRVGVAGDLEMFLHPYYLVRSYNKII